MSFPLPESTTVLIVGAGPTGLAAALSLIHHDFRDFVIVDAVVQGENTSRALVIHAATLEALDSIGCGQVLVDKGFKAQSITIRNRTSELIRTDFSYLKPHTPHPYALALPQNITEQVLGQKLKDLAVHVHRPKRVVGMKRNVRDSLVTDVSFDDGSVISTKYVIGADGARSVVRTTAGIGFADPDGDNSTHVLSQMTLADVTFKGGDISSRGFVGVLNPDTFFLCVDFPNSTNELLAQNGQEISDRIYRIASSIPVADGPPPSHPPKEFMQALVDKYGPTYMSSDPSVNPTPLSIDKLLWSTRFRTHSATADKTFMRLGSNDGATEGGVIMLIGDAAHIHSPAGGQGMNLGLRDAIYLGEVITKHVKLSESQPSVVNDAILLDYATARHKRALEVIGFTKTLLKVGGASYSERLCGWLPISQGRMRDWFLWIAGKSSIFQGRMTWNLSGLGRR